MAHQSLYRAYRPQSFKEVIGQDQVTTALQESIKAEKIGHAYLFSGSRGLGKTSIARIFARELGTTDKDLYEIDAASNTQVDHMRELIDNVYTLPFDSRYKVYILDEAHMLSKSAWNAFLKTLEEPPAHVIFILATTELEKVPETVQSRCQVFEFKKPTREGVAKLITSVAKKEGYTIDPSAADLLALLANGSYRDALSVLEKALSVTKDSTLTREEAERATGTPRHALVDALVCALGEGDTGAALGAIRAAEEASVDMQLFLSLVIEHVRNVLLVRHAPELRASLKAELGEAYEGTEDIAKNGAKLTHTALKVLIDAAARMRYAPVAALPLELAVYELFAE
ncbi:MAG TPA: DNA polymerase III subunit gamma/tau [Candidatus Paceibacterota bacterium]|nr:DNA polymerase III subunit gamma/tau [Candidatus Paceibacterota bacterium]